ncbi:acyl-CoA dehydrogenase [Erwinia sp. Leaf53]|uniref:acyl-CoA dehydrogenase n=1 Tax=Erwinia sp. Leaf53 TaxID=1736225 RepID=UPI001F25C91A|nr:acyl-CoA dehydrogenase [Erwinia sp. Leaf53]
MVKKWIVFFLLYFSFSMAHADEYVNSNGELTFLQDHGFAAFHIKSSNASTSSVCNIDALAESVDTAHGQRSRWVYSDSSSACVAIISELKDGSINVITRNCHSYCGNSSFDSMNGKYIKK